MNPHTPDNEVASLRELLKVYEAVKKLNESAFNIVIKENTKLSDRLHQSLGYAKDALFFARTYENNSQWNKIDELWEKVRELEKETITTAPEEPVSKFSCEYCGDTKWVQGDPCEWCVPENPASKCDHNPNGYCAGCWPAFKKPPRRSAAPKKSK